MSWRGAVVDLFGGPTAYPPVSECFNAFLGGLFFLHKNPTGGTSFPPDVPGDTEGFQKQGGAAKARSEQETRHVYGIMENTCRCWSVWERVS